MSMGLSLDVFPEYLFSSFRRFLKHEKFVTRYCDENVLIFMIDGVLRFHEAGVPIELHPGEYFIQRRGLFQQGVEESEEPYYYYIHFQGDFSHAEKALPLRGKADTERMILLFRELDFLTTMNAPAIAHTAVFYQILSQLFNSRCSPQSSIVQKVLSSVFLEHNTSASLHEIANAVGYCQTHIINAFKKETGKTPHAYISEQRLNAAKKLMLYSDLSLEQISIQCGFGYYINFYKNFSKFEKTSPSDWIRKYKNEAPVHTFSHTKQGDAL